MNIYIGNLAYTATEESLKQLFEQFGQVSTTKIISDKFTGSSRGFGFVEMPSDDEAQRAITELNGEAFEGRNLTVNEARPRENRPPRRNNFH